MSAGAGQSSGGTYSHMPDKVLMNWEFMTENELNSEDVSVASDIDSIIVVATSLRAFRITGRMKLYNSPRCWTECYNKKMIDDLCDISLRKSSKVASCATSRQSAYYEIRIGCDGKVNYFCLFEMLTNQSRDRAVVDTDNNRLLFLKTVVQPALMALKPECISHTYAACFPIEENVKQTLVVHETDWNAFGILVDQNMNNFLTIIRQHRRILSVHFYAQVHGEQFSLRTGHATFENMIQPGEESKQVLVQIHKATTIHPGIGKACFVLSPDYPCGQPTFSTGTGAAVETTRSTSFSYKRVNTNNENMQELFRGKYRMYHPYGLLNAGHIISSAVHANVTYYDEQVGRDMKLDRYVTHVQMYDPNIHILKKSSTLADRLSPEKLAFTPLFLFGGFRYCENYEKMRKDIHVHFICWGEFLEMVARQVNLRIEIVYAMSDTLSSGHILGKYVFNTESGWDVYIKEIALRLAVERHLIICKEGWKRYVKMTAHDLYLNVKQEIYTLFDRDIVREEMVRRWWCGIDEGSVPYEDEVPPPLSSAMVEHIPHLSIDRKCTQVVFDSEILLIYWLTGLDGRLLVAQDRLIKLHQSNLLVNEKYPLIDWSTVGEGFALTFGPRTTTTTSIPAERQRAADEIILVADDDDDDRESSRIAMMQGNGRSPAKKKRSSLLALYPGGNPKKGCHSLRPSIRTTRECRYVEMKVCRYDVDRVPLMSDEEIHNAKGNFTRNLNDEVAKLCIQLWTSQGTEHHYYRRYNETSPGNDADDHDDCNDSDINNVNDKNVQISRLVLNYAITYCRLNGLRIPLDAKTALNASRLRHITEMISGTNVPRRRVVLQKEFTTPLEVVEYLMCDKSRATREELIRKNYNVYPSQLMGGLLTMELILSACVVDRNNIQFRNILTKFIYNHVEIFLYPKDSPGHCNKWRRVFSMKEGSSSSWELAYKACMNYMKITRNNLRAAGIVASENQSWQKQLVTICERMTSPEKIVGALAVSMIFIMANKFDANIIEILIDMNCVSEYCSKQKIRLAELKDLGVLVQNPTRGIINDYTVRPFLEEWLSEQYERLQESRPEGANIVDDPQPPTTTTATKTTMTRTTKTNAAVGDQDGTPAIIVLSNVAVPSQGTTTSSSDISNGKVSAENVITPVTSYFIKTSTSNTTTERMNTTALANPKLKPPPEGNNTAATYSAMEETDNYGNDSPPPPPSSSSPFSAGSQQLYTIVNSDEESIRDAAENSATDESADLEVEKEKAKLLRLTKIRALVLSSRSKIRGGRHFVTGASSASSNDDDDSD